MVTSRHRLLRRRSAAASVAALAMGLMLSAVTEAHRGDGVFVLAEGRWLGGDVAMLVDGSVVGVSESGAWSLTPDRRRVAVPGLSGTGVAPTADGGVLVLQGLLPSDCIPDLDDDCPARVGHRILRWAPGADVSVVAGTGEAGFRGDGGPATAALLNLQPRPSNIFAESLTGIVAHADGGFAFADMGNGRVRAVDAGGTIRTAANELREPVGLAATGDGGYLVTNDSGVVRRLRPDGTIENVARLFALDVVASRDGRAVLADGLWQLWELKRGSRSPRPYLRPRRPAGTFDFAARFVQASRIGSDLTGGLLAQDESVLRYLPRGPTPWTLAALRSTRPSRDGATAVIETTQPGTATLEVWRGKRIVAQVAREVDAGHSTLRAAGPIRSVWYELRVRLDSTNGQTAADEVPIHGARTLTINLARRMLGRDQGQQSDMDIWYRLGDDCRSFGPRRVDCTIAKTGDERDSHAGVVSVTLARTGIVLRRHYDWGPREFQLRPQFRAGEHPVQRLSSGHGGRWAWGP